MMTTDLEAVRSAVLANPTDRLAWLIYADTLEDEGDPRAELVRLMSRERPTRDELKRLAYLRGTVGLLSDSGRARVEAIARTWAVRRETGDVANVEDVLRQSCHPLLMVWGKGRQSAQRLIVVQNKGGGNRWTWAGDNGQGGGGAYPDRAETILAAFATMDTESLERIRWIEIH